VSHPALLKTPIMMTFIPGADEELVHVHHKDVGAADHVRRGLSIAENEWRVAVSNIILTCRSKAPGAPCRSMPCT
jgi:hypothetical protein